MTRFSLAVLAIMIVPRLEAQTISPVPSAIVSPETVYVQAQRLVNEGKGAEGRALVDSLFRLATPGSPAQAEALFWRATLATTAAEAERDYRQITVEHPLSPRAEDALLRLAQLELARGDRTLALAHLERLLREHGSGPARARGAYWSARVYFELNDVRRACQSIDDARSALPASDVELRNQIEYAGQRCPVAVAAATLPPSTPAPSVSASSQPSSPAAAATVPAQDTAARPPADTMVRSPTPAVPAATPPAVATPSPNASRPPPSVPEAQRFSVQVAAYQTKVEADRLVKKYRANGYDARTFGTVAPFRVRIGRFRTRAEAVDLAKVLKAKSGAAFVVVAEPK